MCPDHHLIDISFALLFFFCCTCWGRSAFTVKILLNILFCDLSKLLAQQLIHISLKSVDPKKWTFLTCAVCTVTAGVGVPSMADALIAANQVRTISRVTADVGNFSALVEI